MHLRAMLLLVPCLAWLACAPPVLLDVSVTGFGGDVRSLDVQLLREGAVLRSQVLFRQLDSFFVRLEDGETGAVTLRLVGQRQDGCALAEGRAEIDVPGAGTFPVTVALQALPDELRGCRVVVEKSGLRGGIVRSVPDGIDCGPRCAAEFAPGTMVDLSLLTDEEGDPYRWEGACAGQDRCRVSVPREGPARVAARLATGPLLVQRTGIGGGVVTSSPPGIDCGPRCSAWFPDGTRVRLDVALEAESTFGGWSGACSGSGPCELTIDGPRSVSAELVPPPVGRVVWGVSLSRTAAWIRVAQGGRESLYHYAGTRWVRVLDLFDAYLLAWASAPDELWVYQPRDLGTHLDLGTLLRLKVDRVEQVSLGMDLWLTRLWGTGPNQIWTVDDMNTVRRWDGTIWRQTMPVSDEGTPSYLFGTGPGDFWIHGRDFHHWNGSAWDRSIPTLGLYPTEARNPSRYWPVPPDTLWIGTYGEGRGALLRLDLRTGRVTFRHDLPTTYPEEMQGSGPDDIWVKNSDNGVMRWDGASWKTVLSGVAGDYRQLWVSARNDVWVAGGGNTFQHWDGTSFTPVMSGLPADAGVSCIWGSARDDVWAGSGRGLSHWDGVRWRFVQ